jgi:hypothetical protein
MNQALYAHMNNKRKKIFNELKSHKHTPTTVKLVKVSIKDSLKEKGRN